MKATGETRSVPHIPPRSVPAVIAAVAAFAAAASSASAFDLDDVAEKAKALAGAEYRDPRPQVPRWLLELDYDQWREIRFKPEKTLWRERPLPFQIQLFHPGLYYDRTVEIHVVDAEGVHTVEFSPTLFDYGENGFASRVPQDLGFAGFRIHHPLRSPDYFDEVAVFLGASYFRAVGRDEVFGLSARGLAIDTALPSGEEFPYFKEFWLVRPSPGAEGLAVYALLDSPSLAGAYRFAILPGEQTRMKVTSRLYRRRSVQKLGVAPLTSMFLFGENSARHFDDFRPEVHDSDGLLAAFDGGEWLWRPIDNPTRLRVNGFEAEDPEGFGLVQRDRDFDHYQDLEARPDLRPSAWVEPRGDWGEGRIELVEIPSNEEVNDNIVAYFVPEALPSDLSTPIELDYDLVWYGGELERSLGGWTESTYRGARSSPQAVRLVVDFVGEKLAELPEETVLRGVVTLSPQDTAARLLEQRVHRNPVTGGWRLVIDVATAGEPVEVRAFLKKGPDALTETWTMAIQP